MTEPMSFQMPEAERKRGRAVLDVLSHAVGRDEAEVVVLRRDGRRESAPLPASLLAVVREILAAAVEGGRLAVLPEDTEVSPEQAAQILGVSRPLVVRRMDAGVLPFRYVGSHRRCLLRDVIELRNKDRPIREAQRELADATEELIDKHGL